MRLELASNTSSVTSSLTSNQKMSCSCQWVTFIFHINKLKLLTCSINMGGDIKINKGSHEWSEGPIILLR